MKNETYVRAFYKTGVYVAELIEMQEENQRALVKVLAVLRHPTQGDLHNPKMTNVPFFHQRKALAQFEKTWVPLSSLKSYDEQVPDYKTSLKKALEKQISELESQDTDWSRACLEKLKECQNEYGL
ncbi:kinase-associated lipoprotein B [Halalkalibacter nanhaiisediminis]|uniref:Kinase-associated protein B n=1 Tax=Halalkalibacter nanhaiisediminis TaxID=688079 RepID=A0A562QQA2_9BACI|nr:kinase-associated lipoprotein B [Halalkalibacter nanhaiisediminis]TWI58941.1 kinase-associated protein B [Halalkalibacter nanhaiisediminis]